MERIICVEQPLHKFIDFRASSALSVIEEQERYGEHRAELYKPVYLIYRKEIDNGIDRDPKHAPRYLLFRLSPVHAYRHYTERRYAAPIGRKCRGANEQGQDYLYGHTETLILCYSQHNESPRERPYDARLIEHAPVIKRDKRMPIHEVV